MHAPAPRRFCANTCIGEDKQLITIAIISRQSLYFFCYECCTELIEERSCVKWDVLDSVHEMALVRGGCLESMYVEEGMVGVALSVGVVCFFTN